MHNNDAPEPLNSENNHLPDTARLRWQCRRGLLELDLLLGGFLENCYQDLDDDLKRGFVSLLEHDDQQLLDWLMQGRIDDVKLGPVLARMLDYHNITHYQHPKV